MSLVSFFELVEGLSHCGGGFGAHQFIKGLICLRVVEVLQSQVIDVFSEAFQVRVR